MEQMRHSAPLDARKLNGPQADKTPSITCIGGVCRAHKPHLYWGHMRAHGPHARVRIHTCARTFSYLHSLTLQAPTAFLPAAIVTHVLQAPSTSRCTRPTCVSADSIRTHVLTPPSPVHAPHLRFCRQLAWEEIRVGSPAAQAWLPVSALEDLRLVLCLQRAPERHTTRIVGAHLIPLRPRS